MCSRVHCGLLLHFHRKSDGKWVISSYLIIQHWTNYSTGAYWFSSCAGNDYGLSNVNFFSNLNFPQLKNWSKKSSLQKKNFLFLFDLFFIISEKFLIETYYLSTILNNRKWNKRRRYIRIFMYFSPFCFSCAIKPFFSES